MPRIVERMPEARLEDREGDVSLTDGQLLSISLFAQLQRKPNLHRFPGAVKLRVFRTGQVIFRQGDPGWTAFYLLTTEDVLRLWEGWLAAAGAGEQGQLGQGVLSLRRRAALLAGQPADSPARALARAYVAVGRGPARPRGSPTRLHGPGRAPARLGKNDRDQTIVFPVGTTVRPDMDSFSSPLHEGELFGEMSCLYRTPRSASVVARGDVYALEMLRNVLDLVQKDAALKARTDAVCKQRALGIQLRKLPVFRGLAEDDFEALREGAELLTFEPGQLVCDEHDRSDGVYVVRTGLVKVMKNVSHLLHPRDVIDWGQLGKGLQVGMQYPATPLGKFFAMLPESLRAAYKANPDLAKWTGSLRGEMVLAINDLLKLKDFSGWKEFGHLTSRQDFKDQIARLPEKRDKWTDVDVRFCNRIALELLYPRAVKRHHRLPGPEMILNYCSPGDFFGEMGVMRGTPRSATCMAYGHPNDCGVVELVKVPADSFRRLVARSPELRERVEAKIELHRAETEDAESLPITEDPRRVQSSTRFEELGLIQGQKLMLIDLDRCTRCDECVKACVGTHDDGHTRLFLDGPRFGKYLVPTACRSCLDPVCMIGCPVGSIHRGDNRQIVIEDWCIGCGLCADTCPYGSIQMHDLGLIPEKARGWRFLPGACVKGEKWLRPGFDDRAWAEGQGPFAWTRDLSDAVAQALRRGGAGPGPGDLSAGRQVSGDVVLFRHTFELTKAQVRPGAEMQITLTSLASKVQLWLNGKELTSDDKPKRDGRRLYTLPPRPKEGKDAALAAAPPAPATLAEFVRPGRNAVAVRLEGRVELGDALLTLRLDEIHKPEVPEEEGQAVAEEIREKLVTERAVVCDLCSELPGQQPACVRACPHDAAMRVNARFEFPVG